MKHRTLILAQQLSFWAAALLAAILSWGLGFPLTEAIDLRVSAGFTSRSDGAAKSGCLGSSHEASKAQSTLHRIDFSTAGEDVDALKDEQYGQSQNQVPKEHGSAIDKVTRDCSVLPTAQVLRERVGVQRVEMYWTSTSATDGLGTSSTDGRSPNDKDEYENGDPWQVTLTTQLSLNRLSRLSAMVLRWAGPVSAAVLVCTEADLATVEEWYGHQSEVVTQALDLHVAVGQVDPYPINTLRNLALEGVRNKKGFSLVIDVDAWTVMNAEEMAEDLRQAIRNPMLSGVDQSGGKMVYCVAAMEMASSVRDPTLPETLAQTRSMVLGGSLIAMHDGKRSYSGPFRHREWAEANGEAFVLQYEVMFEPYYAVRTAFVVPFPERFRGRGFNKQAHHFDLFARGYRYVALGNSAIVDLKHDSADWGMSSVSLQDNAPLFRSFRAKVAQENGLFCEEADWVRCDSRGVGCHRVCQSNRVSSPSSGSTSRLKTHHSRAKQIKEAAEEAARASERSREAVHWKLFQDVLHSRSQGGLRKGIPDVEGCQWPHGTGAAPEVDIVFTWVNGSDPLHLAIQQRLIPESARQEKIDIGERQRVPAGDLAFRFRDFDEASTLKFALRSIVQFAPWVRKIWVVTADQTPSWLDVDAAKKSDIPIEFVSHRQIFPKPDEQLPTLNSCAIEAQVHRIPGLSSCYMYLNDDFMLTQPLDYKSLFEDQHTESAQTPLPAVFFATERAPRSGRDKWQEKVANVAKMMNHDWGLRWEHMFMVGHHGHLFVKSVVEEVQAAMAPEFVRTSGEQWRTPYSVWLPFLYNNFYAWNYDAPAQPASVFYFALTTQGGPEAVELAFRRLDEGSYQWFCINDVATEFTDTLKDALLDGLRALFPTPHPAEV